MIQGGVEAPPAARLPDLQDYGSVKVSSLWALWYFKGSRLCLGALYKFNLYYGLCGIFKGLGLIKLDQFCSKQPLP